MFSPRWALLLSLLLLLLLGGLGSEARTPAPTWTVAARRYAGDDGLVVALAYAGRTHHHPLALQVRWPDATLVTPANLSELWLSATDKLFQHEVPDDVDRESPLGDPQLTLVARGREAPWRIGTSLADVQALMGVSVRATAGKARGILNLAWPSATLWARYGSVEFTGSRLIFDAISAHAYDDTVLTLPRAGGTLLVRDSLGHVLATGTNLTLVWAPEQTLTTLPVRLYLAAMVRGGAHWTTRLRLPGVLEEDTDLLSAADVRDASAPLLASDPDPNSTTVRIGRRLMAQLAVGWTALPGTSDSGWMPRYTVHWTRPLPDALRYLAAAMGFVLAFLLGYLASHLLTQLRLLPSLWRVAMGPAAGALAVTTAISTSFEMENMAANGGDDKAALLASANGDRARDKDSAPASWRPYRQAWIAIVLGIGAHILALLYAGHGPVIDTLLEQPLHDMAVALGATSLPLALLLLIELVRVLRRESPRASSPWTALTFAAVHSAVVTRSLVATMLVACGTSMFALVMTSVTFLLTVLFPSVYVALLFATMTLARPRTDYRRHGGWRLVWYAHALVALGVAVVNAVTGALWLFAPLLDVANILYPAIVPAGALWWLLVAAVLAALALLAYEQLRQTAERLREARRAKKQL